MQQEVLSVRQQQLLYVLRASGEWMSRNDLAYATVNDKAQLSPNDIIILDKLCQKGFIERREAPTPNAPHIARYEYRAVVKEVAGGES